MAESSRKPLEASSPETQIGRHRTFLEDQMDPNFGLIDKLYTNSVLVGKEMERIRLPTNTTTDKNTQLLDYILEKNKGAELLQALRDTEQIQLVNFLMNDGEYSSKFGDEWPLGERDTKILMKNHESLVDLLDTSELCIQLYSAGVINRRQKEFIDKKSTDFEKNETLLDMLRRFSRKEYKKTIECLRSSNQSHIAKILSEGGVVVRIHVNSEVSGDSASAGDQVNLAEDEIVREMSILLEGKSPEEAGRLCEAMDEAVASMANLLTDRTPEETNRIQELVQYRLIAVRKGKSIVLYFYCKMMNELVHLHDILISGYLKATVQKVFSRFLTIIKVVALNWSEEELHRQKDFFCQIPIIVDFRNTLKLMMVNENSSVDQIYDLIKREFGLEIGYDFYLVHQANQLQRGSNISIKKEGIYQHSRISVFQHLRGGGRPLEEEEEEKGKNN